MKFSINDGIVFAQFISDKFLHIILQNTKYVDHVFIDIPMKRTA